MSITRGVRQLTIVPRKRGEGGNRDWDIMMGVIWEVGWILNGWRAW